MLAIIGLNLQDWTTFGIIIFLVVLAFLLIAFKILKSLEPPFNLYLKSVIKDCLSSHDRDDAAHAIKFGATKQFIHAHVAEQIMNHDESRKAHAEALGEYPTRVELNGAISRLEAVITSMSDKLTQSRLDQKDDFDKLENKIDRLFEELHKRN